MWVVTKIQQKFENCSLSWFLKTYVFVIVPKPRKTSAVVSITTQSTAGKGRVGSSEPYLLQQPHHYASIVMAFIARVKKRCGRSNFVRAPATDHQAASHSLPSITAVLNCYGAFGSCGGIQSGLHFVMSYISMISIYNQHMSNVTVSVLGSELMKTFEIRKRILNFKFTQKNHSLVNNINI